jgi:ubiquinone/menaquinone biosynthesis C-methylase UbiE
MFKRFFKKIRYRLLAGQLRHPHGKKGLLTGQMMNTANRFMYDFTLEQMQLRDREKVLEIGFGNGHLFPKVCAAANGLQVYGIDHSEQMLKEATLFNQPLIQNGELELVKGTATALPWPDHYFDRIFCINVIYFWEKPLENLTEIKRVLKPGGRFYATCRSKENMHQLPFTAWHFTTYTIEEWEGQLRLAGLKPVQSQTVKEPGLQETNVAFTSEQYCVAAEK